MTNAPLRIVEAPALSLPLDDVDTDIIYPARFLLITEKRGLARYAFADRRDDPAFPIGPLGLGNAEILVVGRNFGCGSSREHAAWALADLGVRVIVGPSFGEIFHANCFNNGILPIRLNDADCERVDMAARAGATFRIDVAAGMIGAPDLGTLRFELAGDRRNALLNGWNEVARIRAMHGADITRFESAQQGAAPWLWSKEIPNA